MTIVVVDTSILLEILGVPGKAQDRDNVAKQLRGYVEQPDTDLLLPLVALVETGNHIAHLKDGRERRSFMEKLVTIARQAHRGEAPWSLVPLPDRGEFDALLDALPDHASRGLGFTDASIVAIWEQQRRRWPARRVLVWSTDGHLGAYDRRP